MDRLLTAQDAAERLQVSVDMVYKLWQRGEMPVVRMGRCVRVTERALAEFVESRTERETATAGWREWPVVKGGR